MSAILRQVNAIGWNRILMFFLAIWLVILILTALPMISSHVATVPDFKQADRLTRALSDLEDLKKQNSELQDLLREISVG